MSRKNLFLLSLCWCLLLLLAACASGPTYQQTKAAIPALGPDQGRIFFYRPSKTWGLTLQPSIIINGRPVGSSKSGGFFYADLPASPYLITCTSENTARLGIDLKPGQVIYVKSYITMGGVLGLINLELASPAQAQKDISSLAYQRILAQRK